jgi:hypothetical protein
MSRRLFTTPALAALVVSLLVPFSLAAQNEAKIRDALSAAPSTISNHAAVMDWDQTMLREGTNGWTCLPDFPGSDGDDPMCGDEASLQWLNAYLNQNTPSITTVGFVYMLAGDAPGSNTDPFAAGPTADNEWLTETTPHLMMFVPDPAMLEGLPTYPAGGPWVMWRNTAFAHVMAPITGPGEMLMIH